MGEEVVGKEVFIGIASCLALAGGLIFYGMQKDQDENEEYDEDKSLPELKEYEEDLEVEKPRQKRKYTKRSFQNDKSSTKRRR